MQNNDSSPVIIFGAGPAGLTAAYELIKQDIAPIVLEKDHTVGGLAKTEHYKGYYFDMGGHRFFTKAQAVNEMWNEVLDEEFLKRPRLSRIFYKNKFFNYPLKPLNALAGLGLIESVFIMCSYVRWQLFPHRPEETFEQWVTNRFGKRLFLTFFKTYTEKVWGISCSELKAEWAAQRIKDLSLKTVVLSMFRKPGTKIKTLIEEFDYPRLGPGMMWTAVKNKVENFGGEVRLENDVVQISRNGDHLQNVVVANNGHRETIEGSNFISSMPLTEFVKKLDPPPPEDVLQAADALSYRDFLTVCLIVNREYLFDDNWIYIHDPSVQVGRIQNYKNWSPDMVPDSSKTGLGLEYFCNEGDDLWTMSDEDLIALGKVEVDKLGLAEGAEIEDGCVFRVPKSYPVYDADYRSHLDVLKEYVGTLKNFQTIGRNGLHRYNNQDHAMLTGMQAVDNLLNQKANDLWSVNAEQEYHEEVRPETERAVEEAIAGTFSKIDRVSFGLSIGVTMALALFIATVFLVIKGGGNVGQNLTLLNQYLPGYTVSVLGSFVGLFYGGLIGFALGWMFAFLRNSFVFAYLAFARRSIERQIVRDFFHRV